MDGVTQDVEGLAGEFGLVFNWAAFNRLLETAPDKALHYVSLASVRSFSRSITAHHQPVINEALDHAKGAAGLDDGDLKEWASTYFAINVDWAEKERAAMAEARPLIDELVEAGVLSRADDGDRLSP